MAHLKLKRTLARGRDKAAIKLPTAKINRSTIYIFWLIWVLSQCRSTVDTRDRRFQTMRNKCFFKRLIVSRLPWHGVSRNVFYSYTAKISPPMWRFVIIDIVTSYYAANAKSKFRRREEFYDPDCVNFFYIAALLFIPSQIRRIWNSRECIVDWC